MLKPLADNAGIEIIFAAKYNSVGGQVIISMSNACSDERAVRVPVQDIGPGIFDDKQELIFQPVERLGQEYSEVEGTGVGLMVSHKLIEEMVGKIGFGSCYGNGLTL